jgi:hypothetical protein
MLQLLKLERFLGRPGDSTRWTSALKVRAATIRRTRRASRDLERRDGVAKALEPQRVQGACREAMLHLVVDLGRDDDLAGLGLVAEPRREIGDAADRRVVEPPLEADPAERRGRRY